MDLGDCMVYRLLLPKVIKIILLRGKPITTGHISSRTYVYICPDNNVDSVPLLLYNMMDLISSLH